MTKSLNELREIKELTEELDLEELGRQTGGIVANLREIAELLERDDVAEVVRQLAEVK